MSQQISGAPVAFVNVTDRERALTFYREILGLVIRSSDEFGDFIDLGGALLRMTVLQGYQPQQYPVLGWNVGDIATAAAALRDKGVAFTVYEGLGQDELGVWTSPDGKSKVALFTDPDGNVLVLSEA